MVNFGTNTRIRYAWQDNQNQATEYDFSSSGGDIITRLLQNGSLQFRSTVTFTTGDIANSNWKATLFYQITPAGVAPNTYGGYQANAMVTRTSAGDSAVITDISLSSLSPNTHYRLTVFAYNFYKSGSTWQPSQQRGIRYVEFWTSRAPNKPVITSPLTNTTVAFGETNPITLEWEHSDDDAVGTSNPIQRDYGGWQVQMRYPGSDPGTWTAWQDFNTNVQATTLPGVMVDAPSWQMIYSNDYTANNLWPEMSELPLFAKPADQVTVAEQVKVIGIISAGTYQFRVRTFDRNAINRNPSTAGANTTSEWSDPITLYVVAPFLNPLPIAPDNDEAIDGNVIDFSWQFRDPRTAGGTQQSRQIRLRLVETDSPWIDVIPPADQASAQESYSWTHSGALEAGLRYEWQVKTVATPGAVESGWGPSAYFWYVPEPGSGEVVPDPEITFPDAGLGCGVNRAFLFKRGGKVPLGEITNTTMIDWERVRDDISEATVQVVLHDEQGKRASRNCEQLLRLARSWLHELVIFRDAGNGMVRVWEGPVTRVSYEVDKVEIKANDVMVWPYRRIMRQGYNDSFRVKGRKYDKDGNITVPGVVLSSPKPVTLRSLCVLQNCLAYDDPNILAYIRLVQRSDDAKESRIVPEFSKTAFGEVDDMAAKAGLDYTTVGRRIILWDTHNALGTLPEMRDEDFDTPPIVTEYGMQAANRYGVSNNNGIYGFAKRDDYLGDYGYIEMLSSAYGEDDEGGSDVTLTAEARAELEETLSKQAERNISARWPVPVVVRVPDNSTLNPNLAVTINQLVPGVHIPLRSTSTLREVSQVQKLDRVRVTQTEDGESVKVTLSPAPRSRDDDPDSDGVDPV